MSKRTLTKQYWYPVFIIFYILFESHKKWTRSSKWGGVYKRTRIHHSSFDYEPKCIFSSFDFPWKNQNSVLYPLIDGGSGFCQTNLPDPNLFGNLNLLMENVGKHKKFNYCLQFSLKLLCFIISFVSLIFTLRELYIIPACLIQ